MQKRRGGEGERMMISNVEKKRQDGWRRRKQPENEVEEVRRGKDEYEEEGREKKNEVEEKGKK